MWKYLALALCLAPNAFAATARGPGWVYWRRGNPTDVQVPTTPGIVFEGGGTDVGAAYRWMCAHAAGGDFLILRAYGTPDYDPYIARLCPGMNSVATLKIHNRHGAFDPFVQRTIGQAEALFIAGGDQSEYVRFWQGTPVQAAINALAARGVPVGGTSAGNAILAQYAFSALHNTVTSAKALADCYQRRITIDDGFLNLSPLLANTITDDHFVTRNRMGRLVTFLARIVNAGTSSPAFGIALNEHTAFLMNADGSGRVVGGSTVYFLRTPGPPEACAPATPVTYEDLSVYRISKGGHFDVKMWSGTGGTEYNLSAIDGVLSSTQAGRRHLLTCDRNGRQGLVLPRWV